MSSMLSNTSNPVPQGAVFKAACRPSKSAFL